MKKTLYGFALALLGVATTATTTFAQKLETTDRSKFRQLGTELPTPNTYRTASGAPGHEYWQQRADYDMQVEIDDDKQTLTGAETITYYNNSPDVLNYLWLQVDQNIYSTNSDTYSTQTGTLPDKINPAMMQFLTSDYNFDGGYKIKSVKDAATGQPLAYLVNKTMMRVLPPKPVGSKQKFSFIIEWSYNINDQLKLGGRSGYEYFAQDKNYLYEIAQFFPRMAVYDDVNGWQHKQFLGRGEFALTFGDYKMAITVPADHIVAASGELQNATEVLTKTQLERFEKAKKADKPVVIVTQAEATEAEKGRAKDKKTWKYVAKNVRDVAFASSRKFIWDAMAVKVGDNNVLAMSYYPKEGNPLWGQYSTEVVAHTLRVYSKHTIDYPYPVAISVHGPVWGMEYPMICFNGGRPETDGTYSDRIKYAMISVIIHEVGHNFFPMIVNSDERQWSWMDEGLNSFCQFLAEQEWDRNYPSRRGPARNMVDYMKGDQSTLEPVMSNSESIKQFGNNAYGKPATALNILRETVMGRELFDYAFKEYARRWAFKHPMPADFFRTMEDASGVDLDWFWRGWFYTTEPVDIAVENVLEYDLDAMNPETEKAKEAEKAKVQDITTIRNKTDIPKTVVESRPEMRDFYNNYNPYEVTPLDKTEYENYLKSLSTEEKAVLNSKKFFYQVNFENKGGLVMPIIVEFEYEDGTKEVQRIPAEIWRMNNDKASKVFALNKKLKGVNLDPYLETADINTENNSFPRKAQPTRFEIFKQRSRMNENPMQRKRREESGKQGMN
ncbi:MAG: M1 family metallopeptidase [Thermoflexibacteraceae bacterium]